MSSRKRTVKTTPAPDFEKEMRLAVAAARNLNMDLGLAMAASMSDTRLQGETDAMRSDALRLLEAATGRSQGDKK